MKIVLGSVWRAEPDQDPAKLVYVVTTNSVIVNDKLVMGRGVALQARRRYPGLPGLAATRIRRRLQLAPSTPYGFILVYWPIQHLSTSGLGIFQVKTDWQLPATPDVIRHSAVRLKIIADMYPDLHFQLNFPGIGAGQLQRRQVLPIISILPDNVSVHIY